MSDRVEAAIRELAAALRAEMAPAVKSTATPRLLSIADTQAALGGWSRASVYKAIGSGAIRTCHAGRRVFVVEASLAGFIDSLAGQAAASTIQRRKAAA